MQLISVHLVINLASLCNTNKFFLYNCRFDDCFFDGWSLNGCSLRWLLNLKMPKFMAILLFPNRPGLMAILLALNKPRLMAIYFLYNQDIIIYKKGIAAVYWFTTIIFIHYHLFNNMEEKHCSCIFSRIIFIHYHLFNNMEERHHSCILIYHNHITSSIIQKKGIAYVYLSDRIIFIHYHLSQNINYYTLLYTPMYSNRFFVLIV